MKQAPSPETLLHSSTHKRPLALSMTQQKYEKKRHLRRDMGALKDNEERNRVVLRRNIYNIKSVASRNIKQEVSPDYTHIYQNDEELVKENEKVKRENADPIVVHPDARYNVFQIK